MHLILFLAFGTVCVAGAINLIAQSHPINSALSLIVVMAALAGEYLLLGAEFVAAVQVIVYAGAIVVLFLFVIMLLGVDRSEDLSTDPIGGQRPLAAAGRCPFSGSTRKFSERSTPSSMMTKRNSTTMAPA